MHPQLPFRSTSGAHWLHSPPSTPGTTFSENRPAGPEKGGADRKEIGTFIFPRRSGCLLRWEGSEERLQIVHDEIPR
jgi:hypothetical protein